ARGSRPVCDGPTSRTNWVITTRCTSCTISSSSPARLRRAALIGWTCFATNRISAPDLARDLDDEPQLPLLVVHGDGITHEVAGEAALRRETELIERQELRGFVDSPLDDVLRLEYGRLRRDEAENDVLALRH